MVSPYNKQWELKHRDERIARRKERYIMNRDSELKQQYEYRRKNPDIIRDVNRRCNEKIRLDVISHYSPSMVCVKCGFSDVRALTIDCINGGHKKLDKAGGGSTFWRMLKRNGYPDGFQVLCMNCQFIKRRENHECINSR